MADKYIAGLVDYAVSRGLIDDGDRVFAVNRILELLKKDSFSPPEGTAQMGLEELLEGLADYAAATGAAGNTAAARYLFTTAVMGALTPFPHEVRAKFQELYALSPRKATDWFYGFAQDTDYIRRYRIEKDLKWKTATEYGDLDITINLSKPEKDPRDIAAAAKAAHSGYPECQLCPENEGYPGRIDHPARQNLRVIPVTLGGEQWFMQYSPYVYYNEHCIALNSRHVPMKTDRSTFVKLLDFIDIFPHYFIGANADLPIVGGSILSHDHFQGGRYDFAMAGAETELPLEFRGYPDVRAGILKWPMSAIRISGVNRDSIISLADRILEVWRGYSDESVSIFSGADGVCHNTVTPIARRRGGEYELDIVLRNNLTTPEHPMGLFHPHSRLHHIKKENIGLIEVMGLAVLPSRLKAEMEGLKAAMLEGRDISGDSALSKHAEWAEALAAKYSFNSANIDGIIKKEIGLIFAQVLEDAGVYKRDRAGKNAFLRFIEAVNM